MGLQTFNFPSLGSVLTAVSISVGNNDRICYAELLANIRWLQIISYVLGRIIYNLYVHPLSRYPGPRLAAISSLYYIYWTNNGQLHTKLKDLNDQYGDVVRIEPSSLVYRSAQPWKDIYGHRRSFVKDDKFFIPSPNGPNILTTFDDAGHARQRRLLSHAFSERALREQESIIQS